MGIVKGNLELTIALNRSTCYFLRTGQCSLNVVSDYYVAPETRTAPSDLLYCPRLYRAMCNRERMKPISVLPCACGHTQVVSGHQRACIAAQKGLELALRAAGDEEKETCRICGEPQTTFEVASGGDRIVTVRAIIDKDEEAD